MIESLPRLDLETAPSTVWRRIVERAWSGSRPETRTDGARIALAIEGGGMAGAVSAGMCVALESLGLIPSFDVIYGSSSGALNASYTAAGQARTHAGLYPHAARAALIDPRRALRGRPPFRLAEVITHLLRLYPHDERVLERRPPVRVTASRVADKRLDVLGDFAGLDELCRAVWASCAIPILAGHIVEFRGRRYVDGALIESMPYRSALREGATHVLVLRTRHAGYRARGYSPGAIRGIRWLLRDEPEALVELLQELPDRYNADASELQSGRNETLCQLAPPRDARHVSRFESRPERLAEAVRLGITTTYHKAAPYLAPPDESALMGRAA